MWRVALVLLLGANLVGAIAFEEEGALRIADRVVTSVLGEAEHDCCCETDCACDHGDPANESCPTDCEAPAAAPSSGTVLAGSAFEIQEALVPAEPRALSRTHSILDFVPAPPTHVPRPS